MHFISKTVPRYEYGIVGPAALPTKLIKQAKSIFRDIKLEENLKKIFHYLAGTEESRVKTKYPRMCKLEMGTVYHSLSCKFC